MGSFHPLFLSWLWSRNFLANIEFFLFLGKRDIFPLCSSHLWWLPNAPWVPRAPKTGQSGSTAHLSVAEPVFYCKDSLADVSSPPDQRWKMNFSSLAMLVVVQEPGTKEKMMLRWPLISCFFISISPCLRHEERAAEMPRGHTMPAKPHPVMRIRGCQVELVSKQSRDLKCLLNAHWQKSAFAERRRLKDSLWREGTRPNHRSFTTFCAARQWAEVTGKSKLGAPSIPFFKENHPPDTRNKLISPQ